MSINKLNYTGSSKILKNIVNAINSLIDGGGGGGSTVTYTPTLTSGTKTGEIDINGTSTDMFAPTPTSVSVTQTLSSGTKIAEIDVNGTSTDLFAPNGGGSADIVHLTQAEYDALPDTKLTDDKVYMIEDADGYAGAGVIGLGSCYSSSEREVGCWTDGKPLYQKTVHITSLPSTAVQTTYPHNISDIDTICDYEMVVHLAGTAKQTFKIDRIDLLNASTIRPQYSIAAYVNSENILVTVGSDRSSASADVTILYTKTTDVAGSGIWSTGNIPLVKYSTTEYIVGTWIDGSPIYQVTIPFSNINLSANTWYSFNISSYLTNPNLVFLKRDMAYYIVSNAERLFSDMSYESPNVLLKSEVARSNISGHITVQYTRTS